MDFHGNEKNCQITCVKCQITCVNCKICVPMSSIHFTMHLCSFLLRWRFTIQHEFQAMRKEACLPANNGHGHSERTTGPPMLHHADRTACSWDLIAGHLGLEQLEQNVIACFNFWTLATWQITVQVPWAPDTLKEDNFNSRFADSKFWLGPPGSPPFWSIVWRIFVM